MMRYWMMLWRTSLDAWVPSGAHNNSGYGWANINEAHQELAYCLRNTIPPKGLAYDYALVDDLAYQPPKPFAG